MSETFTRTNDLATRAAIAAKVWDACCERHMMGGNASRVAAVVENIIAAIQARCEPSEWCEAGASTGEAIERRCAEPSAVAAVLLRLRPGLGGTGIQAHHLGTDAVGRGSGWHKTANAGEIAKACHDAMVEHEIPSGEVFRTLKDIVVAAAHGGQFARDVGVAVGRLIARRMVVS